MRPPRPKTIILQQISSGLRYEVAFFVGQMIAAFNSIFKLQLSVVLGTGSRCCSCILDFGLKGGRFY